MVGGIVSDEGFSDGVENQGAAHPNRVVFDGVLAEVFGRSLPSLDDRISAPLGSDRTGDFGTRDLVPKPQGDISEVAQGARKMSLFDIGIEGSIITVSHRVGEVLVVAVIAATGELLDGFAIEVEGRAACVGGHDQVPLSPFDDDADIGTLVVRGRKPTDFENEFAFPIIVDDDLGVGCFAGIFVAKTSAEGQDTLAESIFAERPSAQVHLMDPLVPEVTVSVFPLPVPIVVEVLTGHG